MIRSTTGILIYIIVQLDEYWCCDALKKKIEFKRSLSERIVLFIETIEVHQSQERIYFNNNNNNNNYRSLTFISEIHCNSYLNFIFISKYWGNKFVTLNIEHVEKDEKEK